MVDRLELAKQYVQEMLEKRDDIVGAFVGGSVARGEATEASDIDIGLIVEDVEEIVRGGTATWRDGVYIEAGLAPRERYGDAEAALRDLAAAGHLKDALILHDPTGLFARVQKEVRARFMEPRWLGLRVHLQLRRLTFDLTSLQDAVADGDALELCCAYPLAMWVAAVPLLINGISPSSTRGLVMVEAVAPELKDRICAWEGSTQLGPDGVVALMPLAEKCLALQESVGSEEWGQGFGYMLRKGEWFVEKGMYRLLKPISFERLQQAIRKYLNENAPLIQPIKEVFTQEKSDSIFVRSNRKMINIKFSEIKYIESLSDYIKIHLTDKTVTTRETISNIETKLPQKDFLRVHRSYIISIDNIDSFTNETIGIGKNEIPISRSCKNDVLYRLESKK